VAAAASALALALPAAAAYADPSPSPGTGGSSSANKVGPATPGTVVCSLKSSAPSQVSGIAATANGILAVESTPTNPLVLWTIDAATCNATSKNYPGVSPREPQDMAVASDSTIWVADTGDSNLTRTSVAFERVAPGARTASISRVTYPDGAKTAKGFVLDGDNLPIIFAVVDGQPGAAMYKPTKALVPNAISGLPPLAKVGDFTTVASDSSAAGARSIVTGAAKSPDGKKVVVRTAAYAYEFDVGADGSVANAITKTKPRVTQLPGEPDGESITYSADGNKFLTLSAKPNGATDNPKLLSYTPFVPPVDTTPPNSNSPNPPTSDGGLSGLIHSLTLNQLTRIVAAVGVVGLVLTIVGIFGIRRGRREEEKHDDDSYDNRPRQRGGAREYDQYAGGGYEAYQQGGHGQNAYDQSGYDQGGHDQYGGNQYSAQHGYDQYGGGQHGGGGGAGFGGSEEGFDPRQDPRRR
jgi:hypothetical protein